MTQKKYWETEEYQENKELYMDLMKITENELNGTDYDFIKKVTLESWTDKYYRKLKPTQDAV